MKTRAIITLLASAVVGSLASLDCGGQVDEASPPCPLLADACTSGAQCRTTMSDGCGMTMPITCSCADGAWHCEDISAHCPPPPPQPQCNDVYQGLACSNKGQSCPYGVSICANAPPSTCVCDGHVFQCVVPPCVKPPACPPPSQVHDGLTCSGMSAGTTCGGMVPYKDCNGMQQTTPTTCHCLNGTFACDPVSPPACMPDAGAPG